ncbi:MAG TPA: NUDIX hydrolase N-terminal domain-containing protein, partial [Acidimicrobiales bacterium]|nr:NUDIX hydrolase N-terminal domain-containing protein [Acidimicrobiales bacterium]
MADNAASTRDLVRWGEALAAIARTGLGFTESLYERERFEEILLVAGEIRAAAAASLIREGQPSLAGDAGGYVQEWLREVGSGVP